MSIIEYVEAREILDSRGNPIVEVGYKSLFKDLICEQRLLKIFTKN